MKLLVLALVPLLVACGGRTGATVDPDEPPPTDVPAASGQVRTAYAVTVLDDGVHDGAQDGAQDGAGKGAPELCLGGVAESLPPQCGGPAILGWDWASLMGDGYEEARGVRWGQFELTGRWDGTSFTMDSARPSTRSGPLTEPPSPAPPADPLPEEELRRLQRELMDRVPGATAAAVVDGRVELGVTYDDGSLQAWADRAYGEGNVVLLPGLVDVG